MAVSDDHNNDETHPHEDDGSGFCVGCGDPADAMVHPQPRAKKPVPRMSADEIADLVRQLVAGQVFTAAQCEPEMMGNIFMPILMGGLTDFEPDSIGMIYEHMSKANEMSVNGYPTFFSCKVVHKDDWAIVVERAITAQEALNKAATGEK